MIGTLREKNVQPGVFCSFPFFLVTRETDSNIVVADGRARTGSYRIHQSAQIVFLWPGEVGGPSWYFHVVFACVTWLPNINCGVRFRKKIPPLPSQTTEIKVSVFL